MPFDDLAADEYSGALDVGGGVCGGQLRDVPYDGGLDGGGVRSQRDRVYADGNAHVTDADAVRVMPREQQLHAEFGGLLRVPPVGVCEHHDDRRGGAESRDGGIPDDGIGVRDLPPDHDVGRGSVQSRRNGFPADQWTRERGLRAVPHRRELCVDDRGERLRELAMPSDHLAADE